MPDSLLYALHCSSDTSRSYLKDGRNTFSRAENVPAVNWALVNLHLSVNRIHAVLLYVAAAVFIDQRNNILNWINRRPDTICSSGAAHLILGLGRRSRNTPLGIFKVKQYGALVPKLQLWTFLMFANRLSRFQEPKEHHDDRTETMLKIYEDSTVSADSPDR